MSHSGGLRAGTWPWGGDQPWHPFEPTSWEQLVSMFPYTQVLFTPGSKYSYSNPGILVPGPDHPGPERRRLRNVCDEEHSHAAGDAQDVFRSRTVPSRCAPIAQLFPDRRRPPRRQVRLRHRNHRRQWRAECTAWRHGRYLGFLIGDSRRGADYDRVLPRASIEEMWKPALAATDGEGGSGNDVRIGLSFFIERHLGVELVGHSGNQNGFLSHLYLHRPSRTAYIVASTRRCRRSRGTDRRSPVR